MKKFSQLLLFFLSISFCHAQKIIFLHHSTGGGVYQQGNVAQWVQAYNKQNGTSYTITERSYPNTPYPWENYPYDYWNLWINGACNNNNSSVECMDKLTQNYDVIVFKHCFPGADVLADQGNASVSSNRKSLENYKLQYRALRTLMDSYPNNKFIVWTLAPLHRNATSVANATRAKQFVDWVKNEWLTEDQKVHPNIFVFDFFGLAAELNATPVNGKVNCLKYAYEGDHNGSDSHPNLLANQTIGPLFSLFVVDAIKKLNTSLDEIKLEDNICIYPNPTNSKITIDFGIGFSNQKEYKIKLINSLNQTIIESAIDYPTTSIELDSTIGKGAYFILFIDGHNQVIHTKKIILQ
jgi:hypothetical protein